MDSNNNDAFNWPLCTPATSTAPATTVFSPPKMLDSATTNPDSSVIFLPCTSTQLDHTDVMSLTLQSPSPANHAKTSDVIHLTDDSDEDHENDGALVVSNFADAQSGVFWGQVTELEKQQHDAIVQKKYRKAALPAPTSFRRRRSSIKSIHKSTRASINKWMKHSVSRHGNRLQMLQPVTPKWSIKPIFSSTPLPK